MTNEEKILALLDKVSQEQDRQGKQLEEVCQLSQKTAVLLETEYHDDLQLLFDGHDLIKQRLDILVPKKDIEHLETEVSLLRSIVVSMGKRLEALEKAQ